MKTKRHILKLGKLIIEEQKIIEKARKLRNLIQAQSGSKQGYYSVCFSGEGDILLTIGLSTYLSLTVVQIQPFIVPLTRRENEEAKARLHYPPILIGEVSGKRLLVEAWSEPIALPVPESQEVAAA